MTLEIFAYETVGDFLKSYVEFRKQQRASWSLGQFSRQLGLSQTSSISRIIDGRRLPGEKIQSSIRNYFNFSAEESRHLDYILERERFANQLDTTNETPWVINRAQNINLLGSLCKNKLAKHFVGTPLEPVSSPEGRVIASLNHNFYKRSNLGTFYQSFFCCLAKPKGSGFLETGLLIFSPVLCSAKIDELSEHWRIRYLQSSGHPKLALQKEINELVFHFDEKREQKERVKEKYEIFVYHQETDALTRSRMTIDTLGWRLPFQSNQDRFFAGSSFQLLTEFDFQPEEWVLHNNLISTLSKPERITGRTTF